MRDYLWAHGLHHIAEIGAPPESKVPALVKATSTASMESQIARQVSIQCTFEQNIKRTFTAAAIVTVDAHQVNIMLPSGEFFPHDIARQSAAAWWALRGLLYYPESLYFKVSIRDTCGESEAQVQRSDYPDKEAILADLDYMRTQCDTKFNVPRSYQARK